MKKSIIPPAGCIITAFFILLLSGCIQENPDLVNPPLIVETVNVRFFNLATDKEPRTLWFDTKIMCTNLPFNSISAPEQPPFDSVTVEIIAPDDTKKYASRSKLKFGRLSNYIMLALPNLAPRPIPDTGYFNTDTLVYLQSNTLKPDDTSKCYVKFLNANPDTSASYSIKTGCPSGENLFIDNSITNVNYLQSTGTQAIYAGNPPISIIKNRPREGRNEVIGIFELQLKSGGQYAIVVNANDEVYLFDELAPESPPALLVPVSERIATVRTINLTSAPVSVDGDAAGNIATQLSPLNIGAPQSVATCNSMSLDKLVLTVGATATDTAFAAFDIYKSYSLLAFESATDAPASLVIVPPLSERTLPQPGLATVRVVNGNYTEGGLTVSTGATATVGDADAGYTSGVRLSANLPAGESSTPVYLSPGTVPVAAFAATQPSRYLFSGLVKIEAGKDYILAFDIADSGKIAIIESKATGGPVDFAPATAFVQIANVATTSIKAQLTSNSAGSILNSASIGSGDLLSTFMPLGNNTLNAGGSALNWTINSIAERTLLVATGTGNELFALQGMSMNANGNLKWRIINAATDCPELNVLNTENGKTVQYPGIKYKTACPPEQYTRDHKYSFVFQNAQTNTTLFTSQDLLMTVNKNYSIIFYGNAQVGYRILILQEY